MSGGGAVVVLENTWQNVGDDGQHANVFMMKERYN